MVLVLPLKAGQGIDSHTQAARASLFDTVLSGRSTLAIPGDTKVSVSMAPALAGGASTSDSLKGINKKIDDETGINFAKFLSFIVKVFVLIFQFFIAAIEKGISLLK